MVKHIEPDQKLDTATEVVLTQWHRGDVERTFSEHDVEMWWSMARAISAAAHDETKGAE